MALAAARGREHALSILERNAAAAALLAVPEQSAAETLTVHLEEYSGAEVLRKRTVASPRDHEWLGRRTSTTSAARVELFHIRHPIHYRRCLAQPSRLLPHDGQARQQRPGGQGASPSCGTRTHRKASRKTLPRKRLQALTAHRDPTSRRRTNAKIVADERRRRRCY